MIPSIARSVCCRFLVGPHDDQDTTGCKRGQVGPLVRFDRATHPSAGYPELRRPPPEEQLVMRRLLLIGVGAAAAAAGVMALDPPAKPAPPPAAVVGPVYVDDDEVSANLTSGLSDLADGGKCLAADTLKEKASTDLVCQLALPVAPADRRLDPEDVYEAARQAVFVIGSVVPDGAGGFDEGRIATAFAIAPDGVLVTCAHVFADTEDDEAYGVADAAGTVYPVTDILAVDTAADVCVFKVAAKKLPVLALAPAPPRVGAWVGVLGHSGDKYFTFTQGTISRYTKQPKVDPAVARHRRARDADDRRTKWLALTADFAYGASGSPVLDRAGRVVGVAAMTETIDFPAEADAAKPAPAGSAVQMVVKLAAPIAAVRKLVGAE